MADEIITEIVQELREDGVYVAPGFRQSIDTDEEAAIQASVARVDQPTYVVALPLRDDDAFAGSAQDLLTRVHDELGQDGWFVAPAYVYADTYRLEAQQWTSSSTGGLDLPYDATYIAEWLHPTDLGAGLVELTTAIADGTVSEKVSEAYEVENAQRAEQGLAPLGDPPSGGGSDDSGATIAVVVALVAVAVVAALAVAARARRRKVRPYALPASVLDRVRAADADRLASRADRDVLELGERIDAARLDASGDATAWQEALDHYDAARRVSGGDEDRDVLDDVGAIVLAGRGSAALEAALAGRRFEPGRPCFLNPLHGASSSRRSVQTTDGTLKVPLCTTCRKDLAAGRAPDTLDVVRDGEPRHYFDTDAEPWVSTGYGSLHPDLVARLHRSGPS